MSDNAASASIQYQEPQIGNNGYGTMIHTDTWYCSTCDEFVDNVSTVGRPTCLACGNPIDTEGNS